MILLEAVLLAEVGPLGIVGIVRAIGGHGFQIIELETDEAKPQLFKHPLDFGQGEAMLLNMEQ